MNNSSIATRSLKALMQADTFVVLRNKRAFILSLLLPFVIILSTNGHKAQAKLGGDLFILSLSITLALISTSILGYALSVARDREKGVFQRLRVTPAPTWTIMTSRLLVQMIADFILVLVVLIVGSRIYNVSLSVGEYLSVIGISVLGAAIFLSIGQALVGLVKSADTINAVARILLIALFFFGLLGMSGQMGPTIETISKWSPMGTLITMFESAVHQVAWNGHTTACLLVSLGYIVVFTVLGIKWFQWEAR